jgi:hypothetical protein
MQGFVHIGHAAASQALDNLVLSNCLSYKISHVIKWGIFALGWILTAIAATQF